LFQDLDLALIAAAAGLEDAFLIGEDLGDAWVVALVQELVAEVGVLLALALGDEPGLRRQQGAVLVM
jgi:hypothetical protein